MKLTKINDELYIDPSKISSIEVKKYTRATRTSSNTISGGYYYQVIGCVEGKSFIFAELSDGNDVYKKIDEVIEGIEKLQHTTSMFNAVDTLLGEKE